MINKTKYAVLMLSANIFLCSAEKKCEFLNLLTISHPHEINNTINTELQEILEDQIEVTPKDEPKLNTNKKKKKVITLKKLLDYGLKQKANEANEESVEKTKEKNLEIIGKLIKEFESSKLPKILKKIVNTENLIEAYKKDETFQKLTYDEQMKLVLMFWCLQSQIEFDFQNETIEEFTAKITYSNIKKTLNEKIEELINEEKDTKKETSEGNIPEEDSKNWESYNTFKIGDDEDIKPLFYYFIKECILTSIAILIHKYCALCKDKFGDVFIGENKGKFTEYTYKQNNKWWGNSDEGDTIAQTKNLFSPNHKYTRICNISFEDLTILIRIIKELPDLSIFRKAAPNKGVDAPNKGVDKEAVEKFFKAFPEYKKLLGFIKEKEKEVTDGKKIKFYKVHFYDIKKFFDQETEVKGIDDTAQKQKEKIKDETLSSQHTFGDLISIDKGIVDKNIKNIKNINTSGKNSEHQVLNLSFNKCKFTNPNVDITNLIEEEKTDEKNNESDNEDSNDFFE